ncbi:hypothetical protein CKO42_03830 [Lamprobacter modestohalophilus]|uniref:Uncharacterized protein n=1 Tax=Lamprobacter modestohalophilus TaxID=1064514 RepID=A0A9X1B2Q3_9GAMM|nr:hypothetical protein [Lamprobacter modestohalophilus]
MPVGSDRVRDEVSLSSCALISIGVQGISGALISSRIQVIEIVQVVKPEFVARGVVPGFGAGDVLCLV